MHATGGGHQAKNLHASSKSEAPSLPPFHPSNKDATQVTENAQKKIVGNTKFLKGSGDKIWRGRELTTGGGARRMPLLYWGLNRCCWCRRPAHEQLRFV